MLVFLPVCLSGVGTERGINGIQAGGKYSKPVKMRLPPVYYKELFLFC